MKTLFRCIILLYCSLLAAATAAEPSGWATSIAWSPDGDTIAVGSSDGLWLFDDAFNEVGRLPLPQFEGFPPTTLDWSADGSLIALAITQIPHLNREYRIYTGDFPILIVDAAKQAVINIIDLPRPSSPIRWRPGDHHILMRSIDGAVYIFNAVTGNTHYIFHEKIDSWKRLAADSVCWVSDRIIALFGAHEIYVLDIAKDEVLYRIEAGKTSTGEIHIPADCGKAGSAIHGFGYAFDLLAGKRKRIHSESGAFDLSDYWYHEGYAVAISYSPDGKKIATNGNSSLCRTAVFDAESLQLITELQGSYAKWGKHFYRDSIAWHPSSEKLAIVGQFDIRIWDANTYALLERFDGFNAGYYNPRRIDTAAGETDTPIQRERRELRCPDFPASMLFKQ